MSTYMGFASSVRGALIALALALALTLAAAPGTAAENFPETVSLPDRSSPEGIAGGPGNTFFAGSRADGSIYRGDLRTGEGAILVAGREGRIAVGMQYDPATGLLWVAGGTTGTVTAYDGRTGREVARYTADAGASPRFLNDVEVTKDGVFVTDSRNAELVVVRTGKGGVLPDAAELLPLTGDFRQEPGDDPDSPANNANGIRALPGGDLLIVSQGRLLRVDPHTGVADLLEQTGGEPLTAGDGLELRGDTLYVVFGFARDTVAVVQLGKGARSFAVTGELRADDLERPTTATLAAGRLWVVNGKFNTIPTPTTFEVVRVSLR
ncbi:MAG: superoxide dismutase [Nitriliruptorales bacterium]|nr:superoxide dismutase [Nitriliruptorales bacterium]